MRWVFGLAMAGGLALLPTTAANAQDLNAFGTYPAGITTGSSYGFYPGGYGQTYVGYPARRGGYYVAPRVRYYSSGFYGGTPGTVTYGNGIDYSTGSAYPYGYTPRYTTGAYVSPVPSTVYYRRGLFGRRYYR